MNAEIPFLFAGAFTIAGGVVKEKGWPKNSTKGVIGIVVLVLFASATNDTKIAPLVRAIGLLFLLTAVMATVRAVNYNRKGK